MSRRQAPDKLVNHEWILGLISNSEWCFHVRKLRFAGASGAQNIPITLYYLLLGRSVLILCLASGHFQNRFVFFVLFLGKNLEFDNFVFFCWGLCFIFGDCVLFLGDCVLFLGFLFYFWEDSWNLTIFLIVKCQKFRNNKTKNTWCPDARLTIKTTLPKLTAPVLVYEFSTR